MARVRTSRRGAPPASALLALVLSLGLIAGCTSDTSSGGARLGHAESWSSVAGGPANTGRGHSAGPEVPELLWSRPLGAPLTGVASSDGLATMVQATVSDRGCNLFALAGEDGRKRWCLRLPTEGPRITATLDGRGSVFVPMHGGVGAVSAEGVNRWFAPTTGVPTTVALLDGRHLLTVSHLGYARVINTQTGLEVSPELPVAGQFTPDGVATGLPWCGTGERGCPGPGPAAVDTDTGTFYMTAWPAGAPTPELVAVRLVPGEHHHLEELWRVPLPEGRLGVPVVLSDDGDVVHVHDRDGALRAYSTADGTELWSVPLGYVPDTPPATLPDGTLVGGGRTTTVWRGPDDPHRDDAGPSPVVAVRADGDTATEVWRRDDLRQLTNPVATGDGRVIVAVRSDSGDDDEPGIALQVLDGDDGTTLHTVEVPAASGPVSGLSLDADDRIALSTAMGAVYVFD